MRTRQLLLGALCVLLAAGCMNDEASEESEFGQEQPAADSPDTSRDVLASGSFEPEGTAAGSAVTGSYELVADGSDGTELMVQLSGLAEGEHAWHVHASPCGSDGALAIPFTATADRQPVTGAEPLRADGSGDATQRVRLSRADWQDVMGMGMGMGMEHSIRVHERGGTDHGPTVACANLDLSRVHGTMMDTAAARPPQY